jgi:aspartyl aminopeptidase
MENGAVMKQMITVATALLPHLPSTLKEGEEIEVEYQLEWEGGFGHDEGEAVVSLVEYIEGDEEIDLTGLVDIELNYEEIEEARIDAQSANDDHVYDSWKERDL